MGLCFEQYGGVVRDANLQAETICQLLQGLLEGMPVGSIGAAALAQQQQTPSLTVS